MGYNQCLVPLGINVNALKWLKLSVLGQNSAGLPFVFPLLQRFSNSKMLSAHYRSGEFRGREAAYHSFRVTAAITGLLCANYRLIIRTLN